MTRKVTAPAGSPAGTEEAAAVVVADTGSDTPGTAGAEEAESEAPVKKTAARKTAKKATAKKVAAKKTATKTVAKKTAAKKTTKKAPARKTVAAEQSSPSAAASARTGESE